MLGGLMMTKDDNLQHRSSSLEKKRTARFLSVNNVNVQQHLVCVFPFHSPSYYNFLCRRLEATAFVSLIVVTLANLYSSIQDAPPTPALVFL